MTREIKAAIEPVKHGLDAQSCRFCCEGQGIYEVEDADISEKFYLCEKHYQEYDLEADSIPEPVVEPIPEP